MLMILEVKKFINTSDYGYLPCVMCRKQATVIAMKTGEPLCEDCMQINEEARSKQ